MPRETDAGAMCVMQFGVVTTTVAATADGMASSCLGDFAVAAAAAAVNLGVVDGSRRRTLGSWLERW